VKSTSLQGKDGSTKFANFDRVYILSKCFALSLINHTASTNFDCIRSDDLKVDTEISLMTDIAQRKIHQFDNGIRVFDDHLTEGQRTRYREHNLHEPEEEFLFLEQILNLPKHGIYVNIGCAIGYYPILAHIKRPDLQFFAVEPLEIHQKFCRENLELNDIDSDKMTLLPYAISECEGESQFLEKDYGSRLIIDGGRNPQAQTKTTLRDWLSLSHLKTILFGSNAASSSAHPLVKVQTKTIDQLIQQLGGTIHFLQMDIQGLEAAALRGAAESVKNHSIHRFMIGTHSEALHQECEAILKSADYRIEYSNPVVPQQPDGMILATADDPNRKI